MKREIKIMSYTKGEWVIENGNYSIYSKTQNPNGEMDKPFICRFHTGIYDYENQEGNAKLISAAPDLLNVLQILVEDFYEGHTSASDIQQAEKAIDKALGL